MAGNNNKGGGGGYSNALGGYGVPSQVKITGESPAPDARRRTRPQGKPRKNSLVFRPKPKHIILLAAIAVAVVVAILFATGVFNQYADSIDSISKETQGSESVTSTNYVAILAEDVDWASLSDGERRGVAKYAVKKALAQAETDQANIFIIVGQTYDRSAFIFYYAPDGTVPYKLNAGIQIMVNAQVTETLEP
jgi:hypothetical protein